MNTATNDHAQPAQTVPEDAFSQLRCELHKARERLTSESWERVRRIVAQMHLRNTGNTIVIPDNPDQIEDLQTLKQLHLATS